MRFKLSQHAKEELVRRNIPLRLLDAVLQNPQQIVAESGNRKCYQSKLDFGGGQVYLLRAVVAEDADPPGVVTVYKTTRIEKYWRSQ